MHMQYSWQEYIYVRCQNCNRVPPGSSKDDTPAPKRSKAAAMNNHSYPSLVGEPEDETAHARNCSLLKTELGKARPDRESVFNLMERTFIRRRQWILSNLPNVSSVIEEYPFLKKISYVMCRA